MASHFCSELPFASVNDDVLFTVLYFPGSFFNINNFCDLEFDPFDIDDYKYNNDLDANDFFTRIRICLSR